MASSHVFAGVGGYYGGNQGNLAGVFRRDAAGADWQHVLTEPEAYTVFVHPRDPNLVLAGTKDGIYRSTDCGATFKRANFPDNGMQVWSFLPDPADNKRILAGASPVADMSPTIATVATQAARSTLCLMFILRSPFSVIKGVPRML